MSKKLSLSLAICAALTAGVCHGQQATYTDGQKVEVREGDIWSAATIVKSEGRKYLVRYQGGTDEEWVTTDRIRSGTPAGTTKAGPAAPTNTAPANPIAAPMWKPNQKVEVKRGAAWRPATVMKLQNGWVLALYGPGNFKEWVEPWRIRAAGSSDDRLGNAPMRPEAKDDQAAPAEPPGEVPAASAPGTPKEWREPALNERVRVFDGGFERQGVLAERKDGRVRVIVDGWPDPKGRWFGEQDVRVPGLRLEVMVGDRVQIHDHMWKSGTVVAREPDRVKVAVDGWEAEIFQKWKTLDEIRPPAENDVPPAKGVAADALKRMPAYKEADTSQAQELTLMAGKARFVPDALASTAQRPAVHGTPLRGAAGDARPRAIVESRGGAGGAVVLSQADNQDLVYLDRINTASGEVIGKAQINIGKDMALADLSPDGTRVMFCKNNRGDRLEIWNIEQPAARRELILFPHVAEKRVFHPITSAMFVGNDHIITTGGQDGDLYLWNVKSGKAVYHSAHTPNGEPALSANGKHLAFSTGKDALVIDAATGRTLVELPAPLAGASRFAFSPSGKQLLACDATRIWAVNLETLELYRDFSVPGSLAISSIAFPADGYALLNSSALVDLERRSPLWKYELPQNTPATMLPSGQLAYALDNDGHSASLVMAIVPHPAALTAAQSMPEGELLLKPGAAVSLQMNLNCSAEERAKIMRHITSQLEANQIKVAPGSMLQLVLSLDQGKVEERAYRDFIFKPGADSGKVMINHTISRIRIEMQGRTIWEVTAKSHDPGGMVRQKPGQTVQQAVDEQTKPDMEIFSTVRLPACLVLPRNPMYMGASELSSRGFRDKKPDPEPEPEPAKPGTPANPNAPTRNTGLPTA